MIQTKDDAEMQAVRADLKMLASKLATTEAMRRMETLSPFQRAKVIEVTSHIIAKSLARMRKKPERIGLLEGN